MRRKGCRTSKKGSNTAALENKKRKGDAMTATKGAKHPPTRALSAKVQSNRMELPEKKLKNSILQIVVDEVEDERAKAEQKGEGPRGIKQRVVENHKRWCPWLTIGMLDYYIRKTQPNKSSSRPLPPPSSSRAPPPPPLESITVSEDASEEFSVLSGSWACLVETSVIGTKTQKSKAKEPSFDDDRDDDVTRRMNEALEYATAEFCKVKQEAGYDKPVKRGAYDAILEVAQRRYLLPFKLRKETVRARAKKCIDLSPINLVHLVTVP